MLCLRSQAQDGFTAMPFVREKGASARKTKLYFEVGSVL